MRSIPALLVTLVIGISMAACSHAPRPPVEPDPPAQAVAPAIVCPSDLTMEADAAPMNVTYAPPVITGGAQPVTATCTVQSGATFAAGTTDVVCAATDAQQRKAQCVFHVAVTVVPRLLGTTVLAFGDSITWGEVAQPVITLHEYDPAHSYPTVLQALLQALLQARYSRQTIAVLNEGEQGRRAVADEDRFATVVQRYRPDAVLLLEGSNDANQQEPGYVARVAQSLRSDVRRAQAEGVRKVYLATLPPETKGSRASNPDGIEDINDMIRDVAAREGAELVEIYGTLEPLKDLLIGDDGLHPTAQGYKVIAETFLKALQQTFEQPPTGGTSVTSRAVRRY
ncbi:MAG: GDSL-type esterase/lipase family protein [Vicinamibacterales bacterium]